MADPSTAREALIAEVMGDLGRLLDRVEALQPAMAETCLALVDARARLAEQLAAFEAHINSLTERVKVLAVKHILARTDEATRRSIEQQSRAMSDAARVAFGAELGATTQRLQSAVQLLIERRERRWERWLTHLAAAAIGAAVVAVLMSLLVAR